MEGRRGLRAFVSGTVDWLGERDAVVENVALTRTQSAARIYDDVKPPDVSDTPQTRLNPRNSPSTTFVDKGERKGQGY